MLAHESIEVIQHLESSTRGVKISNQDNEGKVPKTNECEPCALSKAHRLVSRSSDNAESSNAPFYRITYDLMQLNPAMKKDEWVSHFACHATDFNMVFTHGRKGEASRIVREAINLIETRFNAKVVFFRSDGERSLGNDFNDLLIDKGITYESSTPDTPEQNGHSERKGGILAMKARTMRIDAGQPIYLWPEIVRTAGYIANRTPMKKHQWETPYELVIGNAPDLSHLHQYGCKAYTLNKNLPRKEKMQERAHIGHLIGYEARNIFRIWIPSQRKVIRTRDVMFFDSTGYDARDIDLLQAIKEPMLEMTYEANSLEPVILITEIESDEEEGIKGGSTDKISSSPKENERSYLPTPAPSDSDSISTTTSSSTITNRAPKEVNSNFDIQNILPEGVGRRRTRNQRKEAYSTALTQASNGELDSYHAAFSAHIKASSYASNHQELKSDQHHPKINHFYRDSLPNEPEHYRQMLKHPHAEGFKLAMEIEIKALIFKKTCTEVSYESAVTVGKIPIPTMWVFKYKIR